LCSRFGEHPRWQAGKRAVGLQDDCHFDVVREETPSDDDSLTELRMVRVVDLGFRRVFAGSMPCDRVEAEPLGGYQSFCRSAPPSSGALNGCRAYSPEQPLTANPSTAESCMYIEIAGLIGERIDNDGKGRGFATRAAITGIKK